MMYADRILFGTDLICGYSLSSKGVETLDNAAQENFLKESINFYQLHFDFLATDREVVNPIPQTAKPYIMKGLKLPEEVCEKILFKNAIRIMELS